MLDRLVIKILKL